MTGNFEPEKFLTTSPQLKIKFRFSGRQIIVLNITVIAGFKNLNKGIYVCQKIKNYRSWHENKLGSKIQSVVRFFQWFLNFFRGFRFKQSNKHSEIIKPQYNIGNLDQEPSNFFESPKKFQEILSEKVTKDAENFAKSVFKISSFFEKKGK